MIHLGDITKINGAAVEPVDCITFGSPCQDLSTAGKRAGLAGERSGLFMEATRIIKEMRGATNGIYPTFAIWENVVGAYSSNTGEDFRAVLEELARCVEPGAVIPGPVKGKWSKAGCIAGDSWSVAWRTFNSLGWGVPQSRRRIAVVLDLRGQRAGEILFERWGSGEYSKKTEHAWEVCARNNEKGLARLHTAGRGLDVDYLDNYGGKSELCSEKREFTNTLRSFQPPIVAYVNDTGDAVVRHMTPREEERLQGFPDDWTDIGEWYDSKGKLHKPSDSPRYKALGNSIALPQWWWLTCKIAPYLGECATLASLFDGIGGFPLVWETYHGAGTARWASEIEEFPIAVTKLRFPEPEFEMEDWM